jgi:hypothetical protein
MPVPGKVRIAWFPGGFSSLGTIRLAREIPHAVEWMGLLERGFH